jgi:thiamine biosynthesis lipoprotein
MTSSLLYKSQTRWLFHAHVKIKLSAFWDESVFDELFAEMEDVDKRYNSYSEGSFIDRINRCAGTFAGVDNTTAELLSRLKSLSDDLDGEYDITVMPLIRLWGFYRDDGWRVPSDTELAEVKPAVDYHSVRIGDGKVMIGRGQEIVTGSFVKAFAADRVTACMRVAGITDAMVNAGGSTICALNDESHPFWQVQVNDDGGDGDPLFMLKLAGLCYSTSSAANTYLEIDGKRYGHIISPKSGYPSGNRQVGIISRDALTGDVLSTGLFNFDREAFVQKMALLSAKYGVEGFLTDGNGVTVFSDGFEKYII